MEVIKSSSFAEGKQSRRAFLKKALFRPFMSARIHHKNKSSKSNLLAKAATVARASGSEGVNVLSQSTQEENGVVRMKILVRKEDLEQVLELMRNNNNTNYNNNDNGFDEEDEEASFSIEERLNLLRKEHRRHSSWSPALQTIPEAI
ncbi:hypothetical protein M0R45_009802 [Rubus argutus]|uniref:Uncharacterized protein n=1 Tax=Rubus argutus TaxID=59490 RepID=A0AAW1Y5J2_RUBAR